MKSAAAGSMANCSTRCSKIRRSGLFTPTSPEMTIPSNQARKSNLDELSPLGMLGGTTDLVVVALGNQRQDEGEVEGCIETAQGMAGGVGRRTGVARP